MNIIHKDKRLCHRCHAPISAEDRFCEACGAPAAAAAERSCPSCGEAMSPNARFCARCGARTEGARGLAVRENWDRLRARARAADWPRVALVILPILALLLAGMAGYELGRR